MAAKLRSNLPTDRLRVAVGDFETAALGSGVDAVFSATAYHWISPARQTDRPAELLRTGGVLAIVDLIQVDSPDDLGFFQAAQPIYARYGEQHTGPPAPTREQVEPPIRGVLQADSRFGPVMVRRYDWNQIYTAATYRMLMLSYSNTQMMEESDRLRLLDDVESFVRHTFDDRVTRPLVATLTIASLTGLGIRSS